MANFIDLFSGCGGLSLGLASAGFHGVFAVEAHGDAFATYKQNLIENNQLAHDWPDWLNVGPHDVVNLANKYASELISLRGSVDLIAGGPPCQGFSMNGRRNPDDPRSKMVDAYLDIVELVKPKLVLIENVRGFTSMPHISGGTYDAAVRMRLDSLGYETWADIILASEFGVPQKRNRYICIAAPKGSLPGIDPILRLKTSRVKFLNSKGLSKKPVTVREAISDFTFDGSEPEQDPEWGNRGFKAVSRRDTEQLSEYQKLMRKNSEGQPADRRIPRHNAKTISRMKDILDTCPRGKNISPSDRKRLGIGKRSTNPLDGEAPASTITTLPDDFIHYSEPRTMSVREMARIQSFPDWFSFCGPYTTGGERRQTACPRYTQVGNAVPPLMAEAIGQILLGLLLDQKATEFPDVSMVA